MAQSTTTRTLGEIWGARIAERRKHQGLSQKTLAEIVGVEQQAVSFWERGGVPLDNRKPAIAAALGTTMAELFAYPDDLGPAA